MAKRGMKTSRRACEVARPATPLALHSTDALLSELQRRSLGCLCVCLRVEEQGADAWHYRIKGSTILLGAMSAALSVKTQRFLAEMENL